MQELNIYAFAAAKQSAKAALAATPTKRFVHVAGDIKAATDEGSEPSSDLTKYGDQADWLNSLSGAGTPGSEMTPDEVAYLLWLMHGAETVTAPVNAVDTWALTGAPTGGSITLRYRGEDITVNWNTTAAALQTALEGTNVLAPGDVTATVGPWPAAITLTWGGTQAGRPQPTPTIVANNLTGGATPTFARVSTTPGTKRRHRFVGSALTFFYSTWWKRVGRTDIDRHKFGDCRIGQMVLETSTANKAGRITPSIFSLDPQIHQSADPTWPAMPVKAPLLHTEGRGAYTIDGIVHKGQSQWAATFNEDLSPVYGDDTLVHDLVTGQPGATLAATLLLDADAQALFNRQHFGTATPSNDQRPLRDVAALGTYANSIRQRDGRGDETGDRLDVTFPGMKWVRPEKPDPNPAGGAAEISLAGSMRPLAGQEPYTLDVYCDDVAFTV